MFKPFDKRPAKWLELPSTQSFLTNLSDIRKMDITSLVKTIRGNFSDGSEQGTWFHRDVAIEFARWLNPAFGIWCNNRILELMQHGATANRTTHYSGRSPNRKS